MIRPGTEGEMVLIVSVKFRNGGSLEVRAPRLEATWLRALFARNADPFRALRDMGYEMSPHVDKK